MAKDGILSDRKWDIGGHDDVDAIADAWRRKAIAQRDVSRAGLLASLAHPAFHDDEAFQDIVIDRAFVDFFGAPRSPDDEKIVLGAEAELRRWVVGKDAGKRQRALYALIRFFGPDVDVALGALAAGSDGKNASATLGVLRALTDPIADDREDPRRDGRVMFERLPQTLLPLLRPLLRPKAIAKLVSADYQVAELVIAALMRIDSLEVPDLLVLALDIEEVRLSIVHALQERPTRRSRLQVASSPALRARFERAIAIIEQSRTAGLPNRVEMAIAGALATLVRRDDEMARSTVRVFDLIPGFKSATPEVVTPFAELLRQSIDALNPSELLQVAKLMMLAPKERLVATAAAWVRLDAEQAKAITTRFREGDRAAEEQRWHAVARAHLAWPDRNAAIFALIPERALGAVMAEGGDVPAEIARSVLLDLVTKARNPAELLAAIRAASARREGSIARAVLAKLRETPFRIDAELESLLPDIFGADVEDWVEQDIDGENPFGDRREALKRALAKARARRGSVRA